MRTHWPDPRIALGSRTWPQWRGWRHCPSNGDLVDPDGNRWTPGKLRGAFWILQCWDLRNRIIFADSATITPLLATADMDEERSPGTSGRTHPRDKRRANTAGT